MAAPNQPTGPIQQKLYRAAGAANQQPSGYAALNAIIAAANQIVRATAFGPIDLRGNQASWSPYGSGAERSIAAQATPQEIPFTFVIQEANGVHGQLLQATIGTTFQIVCNIIVGDDAAAYWVEGDIATRTIGFGNPRECTLGLTILRGPLRFIKR